MVKLDLGCGTKKLDGFHGVDVRAFPGVDTVLNLGTQPWPWEDGSVDEAHSSHTVEHLTWPERVHFFNELGRVLKQGGTAKIIVPHWNSARFYGDPTHKEPLSEWFPLYLNKKWRDEQAPHVDYTCDFTHVLGYSLHGESQVRHADFNTFAMSWFKEFCQDIHVTLTKV